MTSMTSRPLTQRVGRKSANAISRTSHESSLCCTRRPRQQSRERRWAGQFHSLPRCVVHGIGRLQCTPQAGRRAASNLIRDKGQPNEFRVKAFQTSSQGRWAYLGGSSVSGSQLSSWLSKTLVTLVTRKMKQNQVKTREQEKDSHGGEALSQSKCSNTSHLRTRRYTLANNARQKQRKNTGKASGRIGQQEGENQKKQQTQHQTNRQQQDRNEGGAAPRPGREDRQGSRQC